MKHVALGIAPTLVSLRLSEWMYNCKTAWIILDYLDSCRINVLCAYVVTGLIPSTAIDELLVCAAHSSPSYTLQSREHGTRPPAVVAIRCFVWMSVHFACMILAGKLCFCSDTYSTYVYYFHGYLFA